MHPILEKIYRTSRVRDEHGKEYNLRFHIDREEGEYLTELIHSDPKICKTLEIGCAYGISSLFICSAIANRENAKHIIVDPYQFDHFNGIGVANLKRANITCFELIENQSEYVLPKFAKEIPGSFDLIFIDGWHTFDQVLLEMFYANLLVKKGGYIIIDDCGWASVSKAVTYILSYPCFELHSQIDDSNKISLKKKVARHFVSILPSFFWIYFVPKIIADKIRRIQYSSMVSIRKIEEDDRRYTWFVDF